MVFDDRGVEVAHEMLHHPEEAQRDGVPRLELKDALIRRARVVQPPGGEGYFNFSMPRREKRACVGGEMNAYLSLRWHVPRLRYVVAQAFCEVCVTCARSRAL